MKNLQFLGQKLFDIIDFSLSVSERTELEESLLNPKGRPGMVLYSYLRREDPNPITEQNELITTIFQRGAEAREKFANFSSPKGYDDRGDIYVRLGNPWKMYPNHSGLLGEMGYATYPYEIWLYKRLHPDLYFTFIRERGIGYFKLVDGPESILGTFYKGRRVFFNRENPGQVVTYLRFNLYEELAGLHPDFKERLSRLQQLIMRELILYRKTGLTRFMWTP